MNQIKIELTLDNVNSKQAIALSNLFESLVNTNSVEEITYGGKHEPIVIGDLKPDPEETKEEAPKKTRAPRGSKVQAGAFEGQDRTESVVDEHEAKAANLTVVEATDENDDLLGEDKPKYTENDVRAAMGEKITHHREAMKSKLTDLGAKKFVDLEVSKYPEFMDFIKNLS